MDETYNTVLGLPGRGRSYFDVDLSAEYYPTTVPIGIMPPTSAVVLLQGLKSNAKFLDSLAEIGQPGSLCSVYPDACDGEARKDDFGTVLQYEEGQAFGLLYQRLVRDGIRVVQLPTQAAKDPSSVDGAIRQISSVNDPVSEARYVAKWLKWLEAHRDIKNVAIIGHSMGGLLARLSLPRMDGGPKVVGVTTVATPHLGGETYLDGEVVSGGLAQARAWARMSSWFGMRDLNSDANRKQARELHTFAGSGHATPSVLTSPLTVISGNLPTDGDGTVSTVSACATPGVWTTFMSVPAVTGSCQKYGSWGDGRHHNSDGDPSRKSIVNDSKALTEIADKAEKMLTTPGKGSGGSASKVAAKSAKSMQTLDSGDEDAFQQLAPETPVASGPVTVSVASPVGGGTIQVRVSRSVDQEEVTGNLNDNGNGADQAAGDGTFTGTLELGSGQWLGFAEKGDQLASLYVSVEDPAVTVSGTPRIEEIEEAASSVTLSVPVEAARPLEVLASAKLTSEGGSVDAGSFSSRKDLAEGAGEISFEIPAEDLAEADRTISVDSLTVTLPDGTPVTSVEALGEVEFDVDQIEPKSTWIGPEDGPYTKLNEATFVIESIGRHLDRVEVSLDEGETWLEAEEPEQVTPLLGRSRIELENLQEGEHLIIARSVRDGIAGTDHAQTVITVDQSAPTITSLDVGGPVTPETVVTVTREASVETGGVTFETELDGDSTWTSYSQSEAVELTEGQHLIRVRATDQAGNTGDWATRVLTVDSVAPVVTITGGPEGATSETRPQFSFEVEDSNPEATFCRFDGAAFEECESLSAPESDLAPGQHTFAVKAIDRAGNESEVATRQFAVAEPLVPAFTLSPTPLVGFAATQIGQTSAPKAFTVKSTGNAPVMIGSISIAGTAAADFSVAGADQCRVEIDPNQTCQFQVLFTPTATGQRSATVRVEAEGLTAKSTSIFGTGQTPSEPDPTVEVSLTPSTHVFPGVTVGRASEPATFTISSNGEATAKITSIAVAGTHPGDFTVTDAGSCVDANIPVGGNCQVTVTFSPSAVGARSATLRVTTQGTSDRTSSLSGTGQAQDDPDPDPNPEIELDPSEKAFPVTVLGVTSAAETFRIYSTGDAPAHIDSIAVTGAAAGDFSLSGQSACLAEMASGDECEISVTFTPGATGPRQATLTVAAEGLAPKQASLAGTGLEPPVILIKEISLNPGIHHFGQVETGTTASRAFVVTSSGSDTATVGSIGLTGSDRAEFELADSESCVAKPLTPAAACSFSVVFTPGSVGEKKAELVIEGDGLTTRRSSLSGAGKAAPSPGSSRLAIQAKPARLTLKGQKPKLIKVTIRNFGEAPSQAGKLCLNDPKRLARKVPCRPVKALAPGQETTVKLPLRVRKVKKGTRKTKLRIQLTVGNQKVSRKVPVTARR